MIVVTVAALSVAAVALVALASGLQLVRAERRQSARERDLLINQICHLTGNPWTPAPRPAADAPRPLSYTTHPESFDWALAEGDADA